GSWSASDLDPDTRPVGRRAILLWGLGAACAGVGIGYASGRFGVVAATTARSEAGGTAEGEGDVHAPSGLLPAPPFVQEMLTIDEAVLVQRAGDYERMSRRYLDHDLAAGFERLLDAATRAERGVRDAASCCAIRTLGKLERYDVIRAWLRSGRNHPEARALAESIVDGGPGGAAKRRSR
ncbi:MAG: hypothetical protein KDC95_13920, partial [Planctomycetes bacterium]|nr:hypothetical protein [Planctomycetota bacterium]